jgi:pseudouridine-5'-phosphate glycosidase
LQHIRTLSAGRTLAVNQALVTTNADLVGKIVVALARLSAKQNTVPKGS